MPIMGTITFIVTSTHIEICTNLGTSVKSHKQIDVMETLRFNQNYMHALNMTIKFSRGSISKCNKFNPTSVENNKE